MEHLMGRVRDSQGGDELACRRHLGQEGGTGRTVDRSEDLRGQGEEVGLPSRIGEGQGTDQGGLIRFDAIISFRRSMRSASTPVNGPIVNWGREPNARASPTAVTFPVNS
jgi:hypothetical protein